MLPLGAFIPRSTWTFIESNIGIICACLPMLKHPLTILFPRLYRATYNNTADTHPSHNNYVINSKRNTWARSNDDDIFAPSTSRASAEKDTGLSRGGSEETIVDLEQLDPAHGIIKKTDVRVSFENDSSNSQSTPPQSIKNTEVKDHFWTTSK